MKNHSSALRSFTSRLHRTLKHSCSNATSRWVSIMAWGMDGLFELTQDASLSGGFATFNIPSAPCARSLCQLFPSRASTAASCTSKTCFRRRCAPYASQSAHVHLRERAGGHEHRLRRLLPLNPAAPEVPSLTDKPPVRRCVEKLPQVRQVRVLSKHSKIYRCWCKAGASPEGH